MASSRISPIKTDTEAKDLDDKPRKKHFCGS